MRFFIALEIPSENRAQFQVIQAKLHTLFSQARLTDLYKIHFILKDKLVEIIQHAVKDVSLFEVTPAYLDGFPNIHHPNILWVGVKGDIDKVLLIREYIKDGLASLHLPVDERRFVPHISIAKFNKEFSVDRNLEINLEKIMTENLTPITISSIKLFESVPNEGFHSHNTLAEIKLA